MNLERAIESRLRTCRPTIFGEMGLIAFANWLHSDNLCSAVHSLRARGRESVSRKLGSRAQFCALRIAAPRALERKPRFVCFRQPSRAMAFEQFLGWHEKGARAQTQLGNAHLADPGYGKKLEIKIDTC